MAYKSSKDFMQTPLTNNTFDMDSTSRVLRKTVETSFASLYRLQRSLIRYEEFFYTTENVKGQPDYGDLFLNKIEQVCMNVPASLVAERDREKFRNSEFFEKEISYQDIKENKQLFDRIPVITIDNHVVKNFSLIIMDDFFTFILPNKKNFLYEKTINEETGNYHYIEHEVHIQIILNSFFSEIKTNSTMLMKNSYSGNDYDRIKMSYIKDLKCSLDTKNLYGTFFAVIYKGEENFGSYLEDVTIDENGDVVIHYEENTLKELKDYTGSITIQFLFYRYLIPFESWRKDGEDFHSKDVISDELYCTEYMVIQKENNEKYNMSIPNENFILIKRKTGEDGLVHSEQIPNKGSMICLYPSTYQIGSPDITPSDRFRVYFFYTDGYNLSYRYLYQFYHKYLQYKFDGYSIEEIVNRTCFVLPFINPENEMEEILNEFILTYAVGSKFYSDNFTSKEAKAYYLFLSDEIKKEDFTFVDSLQYWAENHEDIIESYFGTEENPIEQGFEIPPVNIDFMDIFDFVFFRNGCWYSTEDSYNFSEDYRFDEADYLLDHIKEDAPFEYKVKKLKSFIKDNFNVLHDYVLDQNHVGIKYEFSAEECDLEKRLRTHSEGTGNELPCEMYLFGIAKPDPYQELSARVFVNGFLCVTFIYERYQYSDYIYIPKEDVPDDAYFEIEVYPAMETSSTATFTEESPTITLDYNNPKEDVTATLSDLFMYVGNEYTLDKLSLDNFKVEVVSNRYNYYKDGVPTKVYYYTDWKGNPEKGGSYFDELGRCYNKDGFRVEEKDITPEAIREKLLSGDFVEDENILTDNVYEVHQEKEPLDFTEIVSYDGSLINRENDDVLFTNLGKIKITCINPDLFGKEITIRIVKNPYYITHVAQRYCFPKFDIYAQNSDNIQEYTRVYRDGRLICKNKYDFMPWKGNLTLRTLTKLEKGHTITVDISPYRNRLVYFNVCIADDEENPDLEHLVVDLRGFIDKPYDPRYYDCYLNGRRLRQSQVHPISPWEIKLSGCHSIWNFEVYEKDRDWEYYGITDYSPYFTLSDLIRMTFMKDEKDIRDHLIHDITGDLEPNDNIEERENWDREHDFISIQFEMFYYDRLLPLGVADPNTLQFDQADIEEEFEAIDTFYRKLNDKGESVYHMNPDIFYDPKVKKRDRVRWNVYKMGNGPLEDLEEDIYKEGGDETNG